MINCKWCHNQNCWLAGEDFHIEECDGYYKVTNADRLRHMTDEEIAREFTRLVIGIFVTCNGTVPKQDYPFKNYQGILDWLKDEVRE